MPISEIINNLGEDREFYQNAATPPIVQTSNFCFKTITEMRESLRKEDEIPFYSRGTNPTTQMLCKKMAALEKTEGALAFASGSAAVAAGMMANLKQGDHVVCVKKPYSWTNKLLNILLPRFGVTATMIDGTDPQNYKRVIRPETKILYMESPNSWTFEMQDIEAVVAIAKDHGLLTMIDNSYASPINMNPAELGVDIVYHSATKYISGHSDAVGGILCGDRAMVKKIFEGEYMTFGGVMSPFNAWLMLRGLRTLPLRMKQVGETAGAVVNFLEGHNKIGDIYYPYSQSHPQHALAKKQMKRGTGQFAITLKTSDIDKIELFCNSLRHFVMACSWGGHESLIFPALTLYDSQNYKTGDLPVNMIRFYTGLEEADFLIGDLKQALEII